MIQCTGPIDDTDHPLFHFKIHAIQTNEIFLLAFQVICQIIQKYKTSYRNHSTMKEIGHEDNDVILKLAKNQIKEPNKKRFLYLTLILFMKF